MEPVSGKVIIKSRRNDNHITVGGLKNFWKYNNLIFDASKCNYDIKGETLKGEFYNCTLLVSIKIIFLVLILVKILHS